MQIKYISYAVKHLKAPNTFVCEALAIEDGQLICRYHGTEIHNTIAEAINEADEWLAEYNEDRIASEANAV